MTLYVGMNIDLKVRGTDGFTRKIITDANCVINLFAPPKNPQVNPLDRTSPDVAISAVYNSDSRYFEATVSSSGWASGEWWMQGIVYGGAADYYAFDFESFTLEPLQGRCAGGREGLGGIAARGGPGVLCGKRAAQSIWMPPPARNRDGGCLDGPGSP